VGQPLLPPTFLRRYQSFLPIETTSLPRHPLFPISFQQFFSPKFKNQILSLPSRPRSKILKSRKTPNKK